MTWFDYNPIGRGRTDQFSDLQHDADEQIPFKFIGKLYRLNGTTRSGER
jgi:hypothetical protein